MSEKRTDLPADPTDPDDFDVAEADVERALAERRERVRRPPPADFDVNPEWTDEMIARARLASEVHPPEVVALLVRKPDPDDVPELTDEWFAKATLMDGGKVVRRGKE